MSSAILAFTADVVTTAGGIPDGNGKGRALITIQYKSPRARDNNCFILLIGLIDGDLCQFQATKI
jgi:hypothetical protein